MILDVVYWSVLDKLINIMLKLLINRYGWSFMVVLMCLMIR